MQESLPAKKNASPEAPLIQAVVGEGVAHELGRSRTTEELAAAKNRYRLDLGDTFILGNRKWIIVGILNSAGSTFNLRDLGKTFAHRRVVRQGNVHDIGA